MIKIPEPEELSEFNIADYVVPPVEKYIERRGYMYILWDEKFPECIKVGRTSNCHKRLLGYNSDKPYPTAKMLYISRLFDDVYEAERKVLSYMYSVTQSTTFTKEWFSIDNKEKLIKIIEKAENMES